MLLDNILSPEYHNSILESVKIEDITGDPFEYMIHATYECAYMEGQINLNAICAEYNYLRENGVEAIGESNIIVSIFTAIKNAIVKAFTAIKSFFQSIFNKSGEAIADTTEEIKQAKTQTATASSNTKSADTAKKVTTAPSKPKDDLLDFGNYVYCELSNLANKVLDKYSAADCSNDLKGFVQEYDTYAYSLRGNGEHKIPSAKESKGISKALTDKVDATIGKLQPMKDELADLLNALNSTATEDLKSIDPSCVKEITKESYGNVVALCDAGITKATACRTTFEKSYKETKATLDKYTKIVDEAEKKALETIKQITAGQNANNKHIRDNATSDMASALNKCINLSDSTLIQVNSVLGKIVVRQTQVSKALLTKAKQLKK